MIAVVFEGLENRSGMGDTDQASPIKCCDFFTGNFFLKSVSSFSVTL